MFKLAFANHPFVISLGLNYLLILVSIIGFTLPFYLLFMARHKKENFHGFNQKIEHFFESKQANYLVFFWAFGEALVWFVIPEFLLLLLVFMRIKRKRELLFFDIYGTAAGTLLAFLIHLPERLIDKLPYIQPKMITQTEAWYNDMGIFGLIHQPFSGVPYKVFTHLAPHYGFFIVWFLIFALVVRIGRYFIFYAMFSLSFPVFHKFVYRNYVKLSLIAIFIFSVLLLKVYNSYA